MKLIIDLGTFYSKGDEGRFFQGLRENPAVQSFRGCGCQLILDVRLKLLSRDSLWELIALMWRYGISLSPLAVLAEKSRFAWLRGKHFFWYDNMFPGELASRNSSADEIES